jgi:hypothetical protein
MLFLCVPSVLSVSAVVNALSINSTDDSSGLSWKLVVDQDVKLFRQIRTERL